MVDLDAYFARIGYDGPRTPTLATLRALHELHPAAIVFEAIDVLLGEGVDLAPAAVDAKLVAAGRGGYCFEQNSLFKRVLTALGFQVEGLIARVMWMAGPDDPPNPFTHMALRVTIDGEEWLADVGFGGAVLTEPLRLAETGPQQTAHEAFRLTPSGAHLVQEARLGDRWQPVYELSLEACHDVDYEVANWYTSTHPASGFRKNLMVARTTPAARHTLSGNRLTTRAPDGSMQRRSLSADELERALAETFGLPVRPSWRPIIEAAAAAGEDG